MDFSTMQSEVASRLRLDVTDSAQAALVQRWLNQSHQEIWGRNDWPWALEREIVQTVIDIVAGTVSVAAGGTTVTGVGTAFAATDVGKYIQFQTTDDWYKITAVASTTSLTIEAGFVYTSALSGGTYVIRKVLYNTSTAVEKIMTVRQMTSPEKLTLIPFRQFDLFRPNQIESGNPGVYIVHGYDSSSRWTFSVDPVPSTAMNLEIRYKKKATELTTGTDSYAIPDKWHYVIVDGALYRGLEYVRTSDDDKRAEYKARAFNESVERMVGDAEPQSDYHPIMGNSDRSIGPRHSLQLPGDFDRER